MLDNFCGICNKDIGDKPCPSCRAWASEDQIVSWVKAGNLGWIDLSTTTFLDVSEGIQGEDIITFQYLGVEYESVCIQGHSSPPY